MKTDKGKTKVCERGAASNAYIRKTPKDICSLSDSLMKEKR